MIDYLIERAKANAIGDRTGWARYYGVRCAWYPKSKRYNLFMDDYGCVSRKFLEVWLAAWVRRELGEE